MSYTDTQFPAQGDLPPFILRPSDRARHVRLTFTPREGLVVVVPRGIRGFDAAAVLRERRAWVDGVHARFAERRAIQLGGPDALLPSEVEFSATGELWCVEYRSSRATTVRAGTQAGLLVVQGATDDGVACLAALRRWLQRAAVERLLPLLEDESGRTGLACLSSAVRGQRSRWGSCSSAGSITLNRCLLFLPSELMRAVLLHELAHLRHADHSPAFWRALNALDPDALTHRRAIAQAWDAVPPWAQP